MLKHRSGFTLIELLVVIAIITILLSLSLVAVMKARMSADRSICANNLKQIGLALHSFHDENGGFPMAAEAEEGGMWTAFILPYLEQQQLYDALSFGPNNKWAASLAVYSEQATLQSPNPFTRNMAACQQYIPTYRCPSTLAPVAVTDRSCNLSPGLIVNRVPSNYIGCASGLAENDYKPIWGARVGGMTVTTSLHISELDGIMTCRRRTNNLISQGGMRHIRIAQVKDGLSNTLIVGETEPFVEDTQSRENPNAGRIDHWYIGSEDLELWEGVDWSEACGSTGVPLNFSLSFQFDDPRIPHLGKMEVSFGSRHSNGANMLFADGTVHYINNSIEATVWSNMGTRASQQAAPPSSDW